MRQLDQEDARQCFELMRSLIVYLEDTKVSAEIIYYALAKLVCGYAAVLDNKADFLNYMGLYYDYESFNRPDPEEIH